MIGGFLPYLTTLVLLQIDLTRGPAIISTASYLADWIWFLIHQLLNLGRRTWLRLFFYINVVSISGLDTLRDNIDPILNTQDVLTTLCAWVVVVHPVYLVFVTDFQVVCQWRSVRVAEQINDLMVVLKIASFGFGGTATPHSLYRRTRRLSGQQRRIGFGDWGEERVRGLSVGHLSVVRDRVRF